MKTQNLCVPLLVGDSCRATSSARLDAFERVTKKPSAGFYLQRQANGLTLHHAEAHDYDHGLRIDLLDDRIARRGANARRSPLAKALGLRRHPQPAVLDATCGLGRDSATLALQGCRVHALERHPVLFALLDDALARARLAEPAPAWLGNWHTLEGADARCWIAQPGVPCFDIVYIDPMFTATRRKAKPQKALAWLGELMGSDGDASELLTIARRHARRQTVVKQHARSQPLAAPDRQVHGKAVRFDIYLRRPETSRSG